MLLHILFFIVSLGIVIQASELAATRATLIAQRLRWNEYVIGFLVVAVISVFPEMLIAIMSAARGVPSFGLATLYGSNIADLTLVLAIVVLVSGKDLKVSSSILRADRWYLGLLVLPVLLGLNGAFSRADGVVLIASGLFFYYKLLQRHRLLSPTAELPPEHSTRLAGPATIFFTSIILLLGASALTVSYGQALAYDIGIPPALIGLIVVGLGTTMPELFFSLRAARRNHDRLALGDILGNVITDATIVLGVLAVLYPFTFARTTGLITGLFMVAAGSLLFYLMRSDKLLTRRESIFLILFYAAFAIVELTMGVSG